MSVRARVGVALTLAIGVSACNMIQKRGTCMYTSPPGGSGKPHCGEMRAETCTKHYKGSFELGGTVQDCHEQGYTKCNGKISCQQP